MRAFIMLVYYLQNCLAVTSQSKCYQMYKWNLETQNLCSRWRSVPAVFKSSSFYTSHAITPPVFRVLHIFSTGRGVMKCGSFCSRKSLLRETSEPQILGKNLTNASVNLYGIRFSISQDRGLGHHWSYFQHGARRICWAHVGAIWQERKSEFYVHSSNALQSQSLERIGNFRAMLWRAFDGGQWEWRAVTTPRAWRTDGEGVT